ncbi:MAG TPA: hypothetical protein VMR54_11735 [Thermoanaerobaculia bacterium]|nr:hypothetical protein [Thermoanaerobaculia bacterium]
MPGLFRVSSPGDWALLSACAVLVFLLVISFRSRSTVFCQYLKTMTGVSLKPADVTRAFKAGGKEHVRELFLDLIIREDLKNGPVEIPEGAALQGREESAG